LTCGDRRSPAAGHDRERVDTPALPDLRSASRLAVAAQPHPGFQRADLAPEERAWLEGAAVWGATEGAYAAMHRTKPQTAAFGLTDSPAGLAAWIVEKLRAWSDCDGDVERRFTKDEILTNVTLYWLTGTIGSSMRMYRANAAIPPAQHARRVEVPSGFSLFPGDIVRPPRAWLERTANVVRVTEPARGGHTRRSRGRRRPSSPRCSRISRTARPRAGG
jgi:hypothetical protein